MTTKYELFCHLNQAHPRNDTRFFACEHCKFSTNKHDEIIEHYEDEHQIVDFKPFFCTIDGCEEKFESLGE